MFTVQSCESSRRTAMAGRTLCGQAQRETEAREQSLGVEESVDSRHTLAVGLQHHQPPGMKALSRATGTELAERGRPVGRRGDEARAAAADAPSQHPVAHRLRSAEPE